MMKHKTGLFQRILSILLSFILSSSIVLIPVPVNTWAAEDMMTAEDMTDSSSDELLPEIVSFSELPEEIRQQNVVIGTPMEELVLPDSLTVSYYVQVKNPKDTEVEGTEEEETETEDGSVSENTETEDNSGLKGDVTVPEENTDSEGDVTPPAENTGSEGDVPSEGNTGSGEDAAPPAENTGSGDNMPPAENTGSEDVIIDTEPQPAENPAEIVQETVEVYMTENYAAPDPAEMQDISFSASSDSPEDAENAAIEGDTINVLKTVTLGQITWESAQEYDCTLEGNYVFTPVLPEGYVLSAGASLPEITVTVTAVGVETGSLVTAGIMPLATYMTEITGTATWQDCVLNSPCELIIHEGATLYIAGTVTVSGYVSISGGGTIVRKPGNAHFALNSSSDRLTIENITLDGGNYSSAMQPMISVTGGASVILNSGCTIKDCTRVGNGGAVEISTGSTLTINGARITNCHASGNGGAIYNNGNLTINGGTFTGNSADSGKGGAIYHGASEHTYTYISGGFFSGNGDYAIYDSASPLDGSVGNNKLMLSGNVSFGGDITRAAGTDGIYLDKNGDYERMFYVTSALVNPLTIYVAAARDGYIIAKGDMDYTLQKSDLRNIHVEADGGPWYVKLDDQFQAILTLDPPEDEKYYVYYDGNGSGQSTVDNNGGAGYSNGDTVYVRNGITWEGHIFKGWNTQRNGLGTMYQPGNVLPPIDGDVYLYAIFEEEDTGNGDTGNTEDPGNQGGDDNSGDSGNQGGTGGSGNSGNQGGTGSSGNSGSYEDTSGSDASNGTGIGTSLITLVAQTVNGLRNNNYNGPSPSTGILDYLQLIATIAMIAALSALVLMLIGRHGMTEDEKKALVARLVRWARRGGTPRRLISLVAIFLLLACYHSVGKQTVAAAGAC